MRAILRRRPSSASSTGASAPSTSLTVNTQPSPLQAPSDRMNAGLINQVSWVAVRKRIREQEEREGKKRDKKEDKKEEVKEKPAKKAKKGDPSAASDSATSNGKPHTPHEKDDDRRFVHDAAEAAKIVSTLVASAPSSSSSSAVAPAAPTAPVIPAASAAPSSSSSAGAAPAGPLETEQKADRKVTLTDIDEDKHLTEATRELVETACLLCDLCFSLPQGALYKNADSAQCMPHNVCAVCIRKACGLDRCRSCKSRNLPCSRCDIFNKKAVVEPPMYYNNTQKGGKCPICASCKAPVTFQRCGERNEILNRIKVRCAFFDRKIDAEHPGCTRTIERPAWPGHVNGCDYRVAECNGCSCRFYGFQLAAHEAVCDDVWIDCPECGVRCRRRCKSDHLQDYCPMRDVKCLDCGYKTTASHLECVHLPDECPERMEKCTLGCGQMIKAKLMTEHENDPAKALEHLKCVRADATKVLTHAGKALAASDKAMASTRNALSRSIGNAIDRSIRAPAPERTLDDPANDIFRGFFEGKGPSNGSSSDAKYSALARPGGACNHGRGSAAGCPLCVAERIEAKHGSSNDAKQQSDGICRHGPGSAGWCMFCLRRNEEAKLHPAVEPPAGDASPNTRRRAHYEAFSIRPRSAPAPRNLGRRRVSAPRQAQDRRVAQNTEPESGEEESDTDEEVAAEIEAEEQEELQMELDDLADSE